MTSESLLFLGGLLVAIVLIFLLTLLHRLVERLITNGVSSTDIISSVTAFLAFTATVAAFISAWIFSGQLDEMRKETRAWIPAHVEIASDVLIYRSQNHITQLTIPLHFIFDNIGHTPAVTVTAVAGIIPQFSDTARGQNNIYSLEQGLCGGRSLTNKVGRAVFPSEHVTFDGALIDLFDTTTLNLHPTINSVFLGNGSAIRGIQYLNGHSVLFSVIYGCIFYRFADSIGKSGFAYELLRTGAPDYATGVGLLLDGDHIERGSIALERRT
jgi:hypothetical protein